MPNCPSQDHRFVRRHRSFAAILLAIGCAVSGAAAQHHDPDPEASKSFGDLVRAYRGYTDLRCTSTVTVHAGDGTARGTGEPIRMEMLVGRIDNERRVVLRFRDYTCWIGDGFLTAVHESNPHAYYRSSDAGSPYYALLSAFIELPFPELALAFGEESPEDVVMQLHPKAPWIRPTGLQRIDGEPAALRLRLTSDHEQAELDLDPLTKLPRAMRVRITGGALVPSGSTLEYRHQFEHELPSEPIDLATLRFEPGTRQRTDSIAALPRRAAPPAAGAGAREEPHHELVGQPAPQIVTPLLGGGRFDLEAMRGKVVVLDFWATWCGPCIAAMPHLHRIASEMRDDQRPVEFVTVNTFERFEAAEREERVGRFWTDRKFTLPVAVDMDNGVARAYGVGAIPTTVVIRSDGVVHAVHVGFRQDQLIADVVAALRALEPDEG